MIINHPNKKDYNIMHSFVDCGTRGESIYKYKIKTNGKNGMIQISDYIHYLNNDFMIIVTPVNVLGCGYGELDNDGITLRIKVSNDGIYNVLIVGTRKDEPNKKLIDKIGIEFKKK
jgi:hypothetical protein